MKNGCSWRDVATQTIKSRRRRVSHLRALENHEPHLMSHTVINHLQVNDPQAEVTHVFSPSVIAGYALEPIQRYIKMH